MSRFFYALYVEIWVFDLEVGNLGNQFWMVDERVAIPLNFEDLFVAFDFALVNRIVLVPLAQEGFFLWIDAEAVADREVEERASHVAFVSNRWFKDVLVRTFCRSVF